jgi:hypothetical protein
VSDESAEQSESAAPTITAREIQQLEEKVLDKNEALSRDECKTLLKGLSDALDLADKFQSLSEEANRHTELAVQIGKRAVQDLREHNRCYVPLVVEEIQRAEAKFPTWPDDPLHAVAIIGEEFGELQKAVLERAYESSSSEPEKRVLKCEILDEAVQVAAMALRFIMSMDKYSWAPSNKHSQKPAAPEET